MSGMQAVALASCGGFATWWILNRRNVRGDFVALFYSIAFPFFYWYRRSVCGQSADALSAFPTLSSVYVASVYGATVLYRLSPWHPLSSYPGPRHWWMSSLWLTCVSYKGRRHLVLDELHKHYGPFVRIGPNTLSISSTSAGYIYSAAAHMQKSDAYVMPGHEDRVTLFFKPRVEKLHRERKRLWSHLFTNTGISGLYPALEKRTWELLRTMERRQKENSNISIDLSACFYHWSYDFMGDMVFGGHNKLELMKNGDPQCLIESGKKALVVLDSVGQSPWLMDLIWHLPTGNDIHQFSDLAAGMMRNRVLATEPPPFKDLVTYLSDEGSVPLADLEREAVVAIQGGSDNTSITMSMALFFLACEPKYYQTLREELDHTFSDPLGDLDHTKLAALPYLEGVVNEALRLTTPYFLPRLVPEGGVTIDGQFIPEGTTVALAAYSQQTSPDNFYPEPLAFCPDRWLPGGLGSDMKTNKQALWSFSHGPYVCVAKSFAYQEMRYVIARIVLAFDITLADGFDPKAFKAGVLNMRTTILENPLFVKVRRRKNVQFARLEF